MTVLEDLIKLRNVHNGRIEQLTDQILATGDPDPDNPLHQALGASIGDHSGAVAVIDRIILENRLACTDPSTTDPLRANITNLRDNLARSVDALREAHHDPTAPENARDMAGLLGGYTDGFVQTLNQILDA